MTLNRELTSPSQPVDHHVSETEEQDEDEDEVQTSVHNAIDVSDEEDMHFTTVLNRKRRRQARKMLFSSSPCESSQSTIYSSSSMELPDIIPPDRPTE